MRLLDILLLITLAWGAYSGFKRGLIRELFSISAFVLAGLGSTQFLDQVMEQGARWGYAPGGALSYIVFVLVFILVLVAVRLVGRLVKLLIQPTLLGVVDSLAGSLLGVCKWALLASILLWLSHSLQMPISEVYTEGTWLFPWVQALAPQWLSWCTPWIPGLEEGIERD
ncbi:MAG: CvpA family protein [Roseivirga sp.]